MGIVDRKSVGILGDVGREVERHDMIAQANWDATPTRLISVRIFQPLEEDEEEEEEERTRACSKRHKRIKNGILNYQ